MAGSHSHGTDSLRTAALLAILIAIASTLFFYRLGERDLWDAAETRAAQIAREMIETGDYIVPHLNGEVIATKPPIFHYLILLSYRVFGVDEFSSRFPSALAGVVLAAITFCIGTSILGLRGAFISGLVLILTSKLWWHARSAQMDITFTALIAGAQLCVYRILNGAPRPAPYRVALFALMGIASVTKGLLGLAVPMATCLVYLAWDRRLRDIRLLRPGRGLLIFVAFAAPWFVLFFIQAGSESANEMLFRQQFTRFFNAFDRKQPIYFYFGEIFEVLTPWSLFIPAAALLFAPGSDGTQRQALRFPAVWFSVTFILLSLSQAKRGAYLLPLFPAAALIIGALWEFAIAGPTHGSPACAEESAARGGLLRSIVARKLEISTWLLAIALAAGAIGFPLYVVISGEPRESFPYFEILCIAAGGTALALGAALRRRAFGAAFALTCAITVIFLFFYTYAILPARTWKRSLKPAAANLVLLAGPEGRAASYRIDKPGLYFYSDRRIALFEEPEELATALGGPHHLTCLILEKDYRELKEALPVHCVVSEDENVRKKRALIISNRCASPGDQGGNRHSLIRTSPERS